MNLIKKSLLLAVLVGGLGVGLAYVGNNHAQAQAKFLVNSFADAGFVAEGAGYATNQSTKPQQRLIDGITRIISYLLGFLGIIAVIIVLYAGFLWMTAGGQQDQIDKAKGWLRNGVIGLILILSSYGLVKMTAYYLINASRDDLPNVGTDYYQGGPITYDL